jgi:hypothetical protein
MRVDIGFSFEQMQAVISKADDEAVTPFSFTKPGYARAKKIDGDAAKRRCDIMEEQGLITKALITVRDGWGRLSRGQPGYVLTERGKRELGVKEK